MSAKSYRMINNMYKQYMSGAARHGKWNLVQNKCIGNGKEWNEIHMNL